MKRKYSLLWPVVLMITFLISSFLLIIFFRDTGGGLIPVIAGLAILAIIVGFFYFLFFVLFPLQELRHKMKSVAKGDPVQERKSYHTAEVNSIESSLEEHINHLQEIAKVANDLADGNLNKTYESQGSQDVLGLSLERLQKSIISSNSEVAQRRILDDQQNWSSQGLAKFVEMLRDFSQHVETLSYSFIRELVAYLEMEIGGFFLHEYDKERNSVYVLCGAYAFDREKHLNKSFLSGEGLVGRCAVERASIVLSDIPEDYIQIQSGIGRDTPSTLILVPVIFDDLVIAVIELAGFSQVEQYKIDFLETLGMSIASSLSKATETKAQAN